MELIRLENVKKIYKTGEVITKAVDGIDFTVNKGEFALIIGASGAGKTTVLNILGGMDTATSGKVVVDGKDITNLKNKDLIKYSLSILLNYIFNTQKQVTSNINNINIYNSSEYMVLDMFTRVNLELTGTIRGNKKKG